MNKTILKIILFLGIYFPSFSQNNIPTKNFDSIIEVTQTNSNDLLGKYLYFSEDVPSHYDIHDAQKLSYQRSEKNILNLGFSNKSVWNRFTISNTSDSIVERILRIEKPLQDSIQLFYKKNNAWIVSNTGYMVNTKDKEINGASLYFHLKFEPNSKQIYYLRTKSKYGRSYAIKLLEEENYRSIERGELILVCLLIGILITIVFYNLILGWGLKDPIYFLYGGTVIGGLLTQISVRGFFKRFLIDENLFVQEWCAPFFIAAGSIVTAQFCIKFLETNKYDKLSHRLLKGIIWFQVLAFSYELIRHELFGYYTTNKLVAIGLLIFGFLALFSGIRVYMAGNKSAKYLVIAWASYCATIIMYVCTLLVIIPINVFTVNAYVIGSVLEAILLSLAVADRYRILESEKIKLVTELITKEQDISLKSKEILKLQMESVKQLRSKLEIANNLKKLDKQEEGITLRNVIAQIRSTKLADEKALLLQKELADCNADFINNLTSKFPTLTKTDIEVCSFIKIGLSRKEISNLRKTSLDAIKSTRFRLKKKLNLTAKDSLDDYIRSL
ncbi:7TM diverse intracellular signaling domain-containing protein [uncultured Tenacibaculum sp.]|uniref:7TMR-DISM family protein n=1 Tax=uncultured Tenacibaculum sp. TaxID=174713 RepID=UPI002605C9C4|nr:7TM diverse intracellular signaling domain-containing protein [uncultured Tenacibaculum sp.]